MSPSRYEELYKDVNPSLREKLEAIRMNLHEGKVSCLVGAGFSKNAEMDDTTRMKDWFELADDFYEILYGEKPSDQDVRYKNVLRLASQVEASKGRGTLESLLQSSLPDERVYPGRLHIDLMRLPWSDVFTTNYDTLLEKAFIEADRYYNKVTNKETLLYAPHPRLVKLHGSFPDIRPFIITEEDYRTYPQRFPEFVNTVRQSLIENILCLIGFSGDDPNFLSWKGWLRDVMGKQAAPIYQITYDVQMHDSSIYLSNELGIKIINLADIKGIKGFSEAIDFFLTHVGQKYSTEWSGSNNRSIRNRDSSDINTLISEMRQVRESYPGWIVLPISHINEFSDTKEDIPFWSNIYSECIDISKRIEFLYEINWRIETALGSFDIEWYLQALEELSLEDTEALADAIYQKLLGLKLSLLNVYRIKGKDKAYELLLGEIEVHIPQLTYEQNRQLTYIKCLYGISILNYTDVQKNIDGWNLRLLDYQGHLWKAGMLIEVGQFRESEVMLRDLLKSVKRNILTSRYSSQLASVRSAIELFLWRIDYTYSMDRPKPNPDFDFAGIVRLCCDMINKEDNRASHYQITHGFNLLEFGEQWHLGGGGFKGDYYGTIRYFRLYEKLGSPMGIPNHFSSNIEVKTSMIERLLRYYPKYALQWIVRCCDRKTVDAVNRATLQYLSREEACAFFDESIASCEAGLEQYAGKILQTRILVCLLPVLVKLSTLLTPDRIERIFNMLCIVYREYPQKYDGAEVRTLYKNLSGEYLKRCQTKAMKEPILQSGVRGEEDFEMPELWNNAIEYPMVAGDIAKTGLESSELGTQQAAFKRLKLLKRTKKDYSISSLLDAHINTWRAIPPLSDDKLESFFTFPGDESTMSSIGTDELSSFLKTDFKNDGTSLFIDTISSKLFRLQIGFPRFDKEQHLSFLGKMVEILTDNEGTFKKNDSEDFLGGFHTKVKEIFLVLNYYSQVEGLPTKDCNVWEAFKEAIEQYRQYGYPVITIITHLSYLGIWSKAIINNHIHEALFSNSKSLVYDAGKALVYMAEKQGKIVNQSIIKSIIDKITYIIDESTYAYLNIIIELLLERGINREALVQLEKWIDTLPNRIEHLTISEVIKDDVRYCANQIAGIMSTVCPDWTGLTGWEDYMKKDYIKNDVRNGFEVGVYLASSSLINN